MGRDKRPIAGEGDGCRADGKGHQFVNACLWIIRSGAHWHDLPERYGKYKSVHKRFTRWAKTGVWDEIFAELLKDKKNKYVMIDSTVVRAHQQSKAGKGGSAIRLWGDPAEV